MGRAAGGNRNNRLVWEGEGTKTWLNMGAGVGMGMNHWKREEVGLKKNIPAHLYIAVRDHEQHNSYQIIL